MSDLSPTLQWLVCFALTLALEAPPILLLLRGREPSLPRRLAWLLFANLASHPVAFFVLYGLPLAPWGAIALAELWAWGSESLFYGLVVRHLRPVQALGLSLLANGLSFGLGLGIGSLMGW